MQKKNFCPYCGAKLSSEVRFCPQCGKKLEDDSINNSEEVSQEESIGENIPEQHSSEEIVSDNTPKKQNEGNEISEEFPDGLDENPSGIKKSKTPVFIKSIIGIVVAGLLFGLGYKLFDVVDNKKAQKQAETKKEDTKKIPEKESNSKKIGDQTFHTNIKGIGEVEFISNTPNTNESKYADATFEIEKDGKTYEKLPGYEKNNIRKDKVFQSVDAVSFQDCNSDNADDIIIINSYKENENVKTESRIYIQGSDQKFTLDKDLSTRVNENGSLTTVADIVDYLKQEESNTAEISSKSEQKNSGQEASSDEWKQAYINWVNQRPDWTYVLFDVNGDDIPEIAAIGTCMADGGAVGTYANGKVQEIPIARCGLISVQGQNVVDNSDGHMGRYYDYVYKIDDGRWVQIGDGEYGDDGDTTMETDKYGKSTIKFVYTWNGEKVSEDEYSANLKKLIDVDLADVIGYQGLSSSEIISQIRNYTNDNKIILKQEDGK
ncbi:zinc ribbon domain-containing protein [Dorea longicatena]|uniref:zinc ribbon domain-containing protein n=1 Tax=Dorea longicatena TaxID=88431 RepID=UPI00189D0D20|nr:zinc ribbon domain-containing protein [Dorea longicatena]